MTFVSGIVIFFSIVILMLSIIGLAEKRIFFTRDYIVYVRFSDVIGLQDQAKVYMRGYKIGWTKDIKFEKNGVIVRLDINKKYHIPVDSKFEINTVSLLGEKAITIFPGQSAEYLKPGEVTEGQNKDIVIEIKNILNLLKRRIEKGELDLRVKQISESVGMLHSLLGKMEKKIDQVNIPEYNRQIARLGEAGQNLQKSFTTTSDSLQVSMVKFNQALDHFKSLSTQITEIATKINNGEGSAGELLNNKAYIENLNKTITELNVLIEDIQKHPKKYVKLSLF